MSENRRYYWLKLQETFFEDDTIDFIESQENGEKYVLFYLKLCLKALKNEGKLIRYVGELLMPYDEVGIAKLTNTDVDTVRSALFLFSKIGLIKKLDSGEIYLTQINELIGTETAAAQRKRKQRARENALTEDDKKALPDSTDEISHTDVTPMSQKSHTDIDIDIELDKDKEKDIDSSGEPSVKKGSKKPTFPKEYYTKVIDAYSTNYLKLYDDIPAIDFKVVNGLIKKHFENFGFEAVLKAVTDSIDHDWVVKEAGYSFQSILSSKIMTDLINGTYKHIHKTTQHKKFDGSSMPNFLSDYVEVANG